MDSFTLHKILEAFCAPINEEQAWAVCYQCAKYLQVTVAKIPSSVENRVITSSPRLLNGTESESKNPGNAFGLGDVVLGPDGNIISVTGINSKSPEKQIVKSLGVLVFQALDYGLNDTEEQKLSISLESLIGRMTGEAEVPQDGDEGIVDDVKPDMCLKDVIQECVKHFGKDVDVGAHCKAVCRALVHETGELAMFLERVVSENEKLSSLCEQSDPEDQKQLSGLQRRDWARLWMQVMKELRQGVKLKKVELSLSPSTHSVEYELTPYEILMDDVRRKRYTLNKVLKTVDVYPIRVKKDVHEIILEFIRSRPPLQPANKRILTAPLEKYIDPRERLLIDIRMVKPQLKPIPNRPADSSRMIRTDSQGNQVKKVIKPDLSLLSFNSDNECDNPGDYINGRNRDDDDKNRVSALDLEPLTPLSPKSPPKHLPWQHTEFGHWPAFSKGTKKNETDIVTTASSSSSSSFLMPSSSSSSSHHFFSTSTSTIKSQVDHFVAADFSNFKSMASTMECLSLTVEEVMHIRGVLTKAELECASVNLELHSLLQNGKVCFTCKKVKFSIFGPWPTKCKFCCRNVCSQCSSKMRIPTEHFEHIPVYTLNPSPSSPMDSTPLHCIDGSLTGSAPSSPERELGVPSIAEHFKMKVENDKKLQKTFSLDKKLPMQSERQATTSSVTNEGSAMTRNVFQRANTIRPFSATAGGSSSMKSRILESGPMMNVCCDCKAMIVGIIRASRRCLAMLGQRGACGRAERAYSACPSSRRSYGNPGDDPRSSAAGHRSNK